MSLPDRRELIFNDSAKSYDRCRWALLKWILVLDDEFLEKIKRNNNKFKNLSAVIITLQYLLQVRSSRIFTSDYVNSIFAPS